MRMSVKKAIGFAFWILVVGLVLNAARVHQSTVRAAILPTKPFPYTVTLQEYSVEPDGTATPTGRVTIAVRADGSRVIDTAAANDPGGFAERILSFSSGRKTYIFENKRQKSTTFAPDRYVSSHWLADPHNDCLVAGESGQEIGGIETVSGYRAVKLTGAGVTRWLAIDYGCALIKGRVELGDGLAAEKRLVVLVAGEPSASLFDEPAGFQEVPPSVIFSTSAHDGYYYAHKPAGSSGVSPKTSQR